MPERTFGRRSTQKAQNGRPAQGIAKPRDICLSEQAYSQARVGLVLDPTFTIRR